MHPFSAMYYVFEALKVELDLNEIYKTFNFCSYNHDCYNRESLCSNVTI